MKEITYNEFVKKYKKTNKKWKFNLFGIVCKKCGSNRVEFNSDMELERGYYDDWSVEGKIIVKCHSCGNAFTLDFYEIENDQ
jgi:hypothetical protein